MLELFNGALDVRSIYNRWYDSNLGSNNGAFVTFTGIVREEDGISGLSFDVYEPILNSWFNSWSEKAKAKGAVILMAHSIGDVLICESSFMCTILSPKRRVALELIDAFVEDFKASAPIWKYDLKDGKRVYALDRSTALKSAGLLA